MSSNSNMVIHITGTGSYVRVFRDHDQPWVVIGVTEGVMKRSADIELTFGQARELAALLLGAIDKGATNGVK